MSVTQKDATGASYLAKTTTIGGQEIYVMLAGEHTRTYDGVQSLALSGASQSLTVPAASTHAFVVAEGGTANDYCRTWHSGATPTASVGIKLFDGQSFSTADPRTLKAIVGSGTVTLRIEYYHYA